ncbi:extracellular solute-binding protein [Mesorhizobium sp. 8]|uniref:ABC transporter substrate-binding protein n=1 Tax=Mesorhizobium sp. 8 TaxID=2584466 RepID=UPI0011245C0F|nr:extracellular solute-binding protein [Mesorhizobium sp. 8]QDC00696.1 extracellular solute-binding protein [Mesorhizobium sp. 8]
MKFGFNTSVTRRTLIAAGLAAAVSGGGAMAADQTLIDAAKKEGEVVWYSSLIVNQLVRPFAEAFEAKYGIKVHYSRTPAGEMALKLVNEIKADSLQADVFDGNSAFFQAMPLDNLVAYSPPPAADYPAELKDAGGRYHAINVAVLTTSVNTSLVPEAEWPKTYDDLLDPKWQGKMAWTTDLTPNGPPGFIGNILKVYGEDKGMDYLGKLAAQDIVKVPASQRVVLDQVIAGEHMLGLMTFDHHAVISAAKGAPVAWLRIEPLVSTGNYVGLLKNSPHPNAGKLFIDYILSMEGQEVFQKANYLPAHPNVPAANVELKPEGGHFKATVITNEEALAGLPKWTRIYKDLFE